MSVEAQPSQRLALSIEEAAESMGIHPKTFRRYVMPRIRVTMVGGRRLVAVRELERYLEEKAA